MSIILGCIADDFTGASDLASFLVGSGMRTAMVIGVPQTELVLDEIDAVVVALKSRTEPKKEAIADSLKALKWLQSLDAEQFYFKYCSTFDSTSKGNIGPVADALLEALDEKSTILCPSLPVNGRTVYNGYLFVNEGLLNESGMESHPLTPMRDANLLRVMSSQTDGKVGLINHVIISQGVESVQQALESLTPEHRYVVVDTIDTEALKVIGHACADMKLITGGSGLAIGLADNYEAKNLLTKSETIKLGSSEGGSIVLSGSCSKTTLLQVEAFKQGHKSYKLDPLKISKGEQTVEQALAWYKENTESGPLLVYASDNPDAIKSVQKELGVAAAGNLVEGFVSSLAKELSSIGVTRFVVAGGETSGSVVKALEASSFVIGPSVSPGVPLIQSIGKNPQIFALKSGNFGDENFFHRALEMMG